MFESESGGWIARYPGLELRKRALENFGQSHSNRSIGFGNSSVLSHNYTNRIVTRKILSESHEQRLEIDSDTDRKTNIDTSYLGNYQIRNCYIRNC